MGKLAKEDVGDGLLNTVWVVKKKKKSMVVGGILRGIKEKIALHDQVKKVLTKILVAWTQKKKSLI